MFLIKMTIGSGIVGNQRNLRGFKGNLTKLRILFHLKENRISCNLFFLSSDFSKVFVLEFLLYQKVVFRLASNRFAFPSQWWMVQSLLGCYRPSLDIETLLEHQDTKGYNVFDNQVFCRSDNKKWVKLYWMRKGFYNHAILHHHAILHIQNTCETWT